MKQYRETQTGQAKCSECEYAKNNKCPIECQQSLICPRLPDLIMNRILVAPAEEERLYAMIEN